MAGPNTATVSAAYRIHSSHAGRGFGMTPRAIGPGGLGMVQAIAIILIALQTHWHWLGPGGLGGLCIFSN